jgi:hypothetical protein
VEVVIGASSASRDEAHFDANGEAVMVGRRAVAAKRTFEEMCL